MTRRRLLAWEFLLGISIPTSSIAFQDSAYQEQNADSDRLLWILTSIISIYGVVYYKREGYLPGFSRSPTNAQMIDPDKEAFSAAPHGDEYEPVHGQEHEMLHDVEHEGVPYDGGEGHYGGGSGSGYGGGYVPPTVHDEPTGYGGAGGLGGHSEPTGYGGAGAVNNGRVQFPSARYDDL